VHLIDPASLPEPWRSVGFGLSFVVFGLVVLVIPLAGAAFAILSAARRRQPALLAIQALLGALLVIFYLTPLYREDLVASLLPPLVFVLQLWLRRRISA
jgi:hypothetical protein